MVLVKSGDAGLQFPVVTINAKGERWKCRDVERLSRIVPIQYKMGRFDGLEIIDASNRRWAVRSIRKVGRMERWNILHILFFSPPDWRVEYDLEEQAPLPTADQSARQRIGMESSVADWTLGDEENAGESAGEDLDLPHRARSQSDGTTAASQPAQSGKAMPIIRASEVDFHYPLVGFTRDEGVLGFDDFSALTRCHPIYVRDEALIGMELIDNDLGRWFVRALVLEAPLVEKRWWQIFSGTTYPEFDLELEEAAPIRLAELKRRLLDAWELEDMGDEEAVERAPDLAAMFEAAYQQGSGLL